MKDDHLKRMDPKDIAETVSLGKLKPAQIKRYVIANEDKIDPVEAGDLADEF